MSKSFKTFDSTILASLGAIVKTLKLGIGYYENGPKDADVPEIVLTSASKFAIVTSVAAFDRYYTERFSEALIPFLHIKEPTRELAKLLENAGVDVYETLKLIRMDSPHRRIRSLIHRHLKTYITQDEKRINQLYKCYGLTKFLENSERLTKRKTLRKRAFWLIHLRHKIVHDCDLNRKGAIRHLSKKESNRISKAILDMRKLVTASEQLLEKAGF